MALSDVFLSGKELSSYYSIFEANFTCCYPIPIGSCVSQRMQQLTKFPFTPTPAEQLQIHRELTGMFTELALSALSVSRDAKPIPAYLLSMKADFEENYAENHSLEYFEQALGISRYRLCREFSSVSIFLHSSIFRRKNRSSHIAAPIYR